MQYILELISGSGEMYYDDWHTSARYHEIFNSDLNHDGKVNEDDKTYRKAFDSLNIGILTSFNSFSSGNAFPFFARERPDKKIKIFGERSGGGSCVAGVAVTADGFPFSFSINMRLCSADFSKTAEGGAEVDYPLEYEKFYDKTELLKALHDTEKGFGAY